MGVQDSKKVGVQDSHHSHPGFPISRKRKVGVHDFTRKVGVHDFTISAVSFLPRFLLPRFPVSRIPSPKEWVPTIPPTTITMILKMDSGRPRKANCGGILMSQECCISRALWQECCCLIYLAENKKKSWVRIQSTREDQLRLFKARFAPEPRYTRAGNYSLPDLVADNMEIP